MHLITLAAYTTYINMECVSLHPVFDLMQIQDCVLTPRFVFNSFSDMHSTDVDSLVNLAKYDQHFCFFISPN